MLQNLSMIVFLAFVSLNAQAGTVATQSLPIVNGWDIARVTVSEAPDAGGPIALNVANDCSTLNLNRPRALEGIDWNTIIAIGEKIWQIVEANKPVVNVTTQVVHALPRGLVCWSDLEHWHAPVVKAYEVSYKNGFGYEVVKFRFGQLIHHVDRSLVYGQNVC